MNRTDGVTVVRAGGLVLAKIMSDALIRKRERSVWLLTPRTVPVIASGIGN